MKALISAFLLIVVIVPSASADVISINSGGSDNIIISPDSLIDGFFSQTPITPITSSVSSTTPSDEGGFWITLPEIPPCHDYKVISFVADTNAEFGYSNYTLQIMNGADEQRFYIRLSENMRQLCEITEQRNLPASVFQYLTIAFTCRISNGTEVGNMTLYTDMEMCNQSFTISVSKSEGLLADMDIWLDNLLTMQEPADIQYQTTTVVAGFDTRTWVLWLMIGIGILLVIGGTVRYVLL